MSKSGQVIYKIHSIREDDQHKARDPHRHANKRTVYQARFYDTAKPLTAPPDASVEKSYRLVGQTEIFADLQSCYQAAVAAAQQMNGLKSLPAHIAADLVLANA